MYWECEEHIMAEDGYSEDYKVSQEYSLKKIAYGLKSVIKEPLLRETVRSRTATEVWVVNPAWRVWLRLIEEYTSRDMTYQTDKLPALSGVVSALQELTGDMCFAGIWKSWFLKGLLWRLQDPEWDIYVFLPKKPHNASLWRAPSWSFASVEGVVLYTLLENDPSRETCAELQECSVTPKGSNTLGELVSGFARIKGSVARVINIAKELSSVGRVCMICMEAGRFAEGSVYFDVDNYETCDVLMVTPYTGIAMIPVDTQQDTYVRVGAVSVYRIFDPENELHNIDRPASVNRDRSLGAAHYPAPTIITLL
jgi:hypothetical protein